MCSTPPARGAPAADATGAEIERALVSTAAAHPNITFFEHHLAVDLLSELGNGVACMGIGAIDSSRGHAQECAVCCRAGRPQRVCTSATPSDCLLVLCLLPALQSTRCRACATAWAPMCWTSRRCA